MGEPETPVTAAKEHDYNAELVELMRQIVRIQSLTSPDKVHAAITQNSEAAVHELRAMLAAVGVTAGTDRPEEPLVIANLYSEFTGSLSSDEYVLPPELTKAHEGIVRSLRSRRPVSLQPYSGMILYGIRGTGKTEYVSHLRSCLDQDCVFVQGDVSKIRFEKKDAGNTLKQLLRGLDEQVVTSQGNISTIVLFLDEFDELINAHMAQATTRRKEERASGRSHSTHTIDEMTNSFTFDEIGRDILASFKATMGGQTGVQHVYIIAASNQMEFPEPMVRGGRFEAVQLHSFGLPLAIATARSGDGQLVGNYNSYRKSLPRHIAIMQAAHWREHQTNNPVLAELASGLQNCLAEVPYQKPTRGRGTHPHVDREYNSKVLQQILTGLGYNVARFSNEVRRGFSGLSYGDYVTGCHEDALTAEIEHMLEATPSEVATHYKLHPDHFRNLDSAKRSLAKLVFPSLDVPDEELYEQ